jgi:hypothetical protein
MSSNYQVKIGQVATEVIPMLDKLVTDEWLAKRRLALAKRKSLISWEYLCRISTSSNNDYFGWTYLMPFLIRELDKCNINDNVYSQAILDWAEIQEITPQAAFNELEMKMQGIGLSYMRNYAFYNKYARLITMSQTIEEVQKNFEFSSSERRRPLN